MVRTSHVAALCLAVGVAFPLLVMHERTSLPLALGRRPELTVLGVFGAAVVAMANGANDIANSVGTSYGAGALTLAQAIGFGAAAEFAGAMSLGSFVAKTISKGVIEPKSFAAAGCHGVLEYGLGMVSVLFGTGSTTLLATLYGLPISASHGVIGGLLAVGIYAHGTESIGTAPLLATVVAWVASPLVGGVTAGMIHLAVRSAVHARRDPTRAADALQPVLLALTVTVAAAFLFVSGPAVIRIKPASRGAAASVGLGVVAALASYGYRMLNPPPRPADHPWSRHLEEMDGTELPTTRRGGRTKRLQAQPLPPPGRGGSDGADGDPDSSLLLCCVAPRRFCVGGRDKTVPPLASRAGHSDGEDEEGTMVSGQGQGPGARRAASALEHAAEERPFVPLLVISALTVAFAHGANDLGNSIGPLAAILITERSHGDITAQPAIPMWLLALGSCGFVVGIILLGSRTIRTVGGKITTLTPSRSFAVQMGTAVAVLTSTELGLAVSTSHCLVGAIIGIGAAERIRGAANADLNLSMIYRIILGWAATIPLAMLVSVLALAAMEPVYRHDALCRDTHEHHHA